MFGKQNRSQSPSVAIELLESRRLLSASHAVIPILTGAAFMGTAIATDGNSGTIVLTVTSESKKGVCKGTAEISVLGFSDTLSATASVNAKGKISLHFNSRHATLTTTGTASATFISGKFALKYSIRSLHGSSHGTFTLSRSG
jgi:hypothetical protein